jgi:hypothetical protein
MVNVVLLCHRMSVCAHYANDVAGDVGVFASWRPRLARDRGCTSPFTSCRVRFTKLGPTAASELRQYWRMHLLPYRPTRRHLR